MMSFFTSFETGWSPSAVLMYDKLWNNAIEGSKWETLDWFHLIPFAGIQTAQITAKSIMAICVSSAGPVRVPNDISARPAKRHS